MEIKETTTEKEEIDLLAEIQKLKETTVSRDEYDKLKKEKNEIITKFLNGSGRDGEENDFKKADADRISKRLMNTDNVQSNISYWTDVLQLRDYYLENDGKDIFLSGANTSEDDRKKAQMIADTINDILKVADGDADVFNRELNRILKAPAFVKN